MKLVFVFLSAIVFPHYASAQPYKCMFANGSVVETKFPCDPVMIEKFGNRLTQLYPDVRQMNLSPEYTKNLYVMAMADCDEPFIRMTPEQIGKNGEPFFPWQMGAAMAQAAREIICPETK
jgi:hypothetical protein